MAKEIKVPQIAEGADSATVTEILVSKGDKVEKDQSLIVVESDKASVEIPSPESGTVKSLNISEGDEVKVGDVILSLEAPDSQESSDDGPAPPEGGDQDNKEEESDEPKKEEKENEPSEETDKAEEKNEKKPSDEGNTDEGDDEVPENKGSNNDVDENNEDDKDKQTDENEESDTEKEDGSNSIAKDKKEKSSKPKKDKEKNEEGKTHKTEVGVAPGVRRLARELGIHLNDVEGSGNAGHISQEDVKAHAKKNNAESDSKKLPPLPDFSQWGETESKSLSGIRSATAKNVSRSWDTIPHVFQFEEAEISGIEKYRDTHSKKAKEAGGKLTLTAVLVKIVAGALRQFPKFNASIDMVNEQMILKKYVNIGIAVDTEKGLLVPVLKNVDKKSIIEISVELTKIAEKAREGKLGPDEMQGGNFTISNLGGIGGTQFTPIILPPQVAILGVSRSDKKPVFLNGKFGARNILPLSLSYDHRLIDGAEGVRFIDWIARALEDPYSALLEG